MAAIAVTFSSWSTRTIPDQLRSFAKLTDALGQRGGQALASHVHPGLAGSGPRRHGTRDRIGPGCACCGLPRRLDEEGSAARARADSLSPLARGSLSGLNILAKSGRVDFVPIADRLMDSPDAEIRAAAAWPRAARLLTGSSV
jgi:hypothetical protein